MKKQSKLIHELSLKYGLPTQVIELICTSPFSFTKEKIAQSDDRPIMFAYLGKFKKKKKYLNEDTRV